MSLEFHTTSYCCHVCGRDFEFSEWLNDNESEPVHEPILSCPFCKEMVFRVDRRERDMIKAYVHLKREVKELAYVRMMENEGET